MITLYKPALKDMGFRQKLLADAETMSYNLAYGGTISFPEENWSGWVNKWINSSNEKFFYRYLQQEDTKEFIGEVAYHYDEGREIVICEVIVSAPYRKNGFGTLGLQLLCEAAKSNGISELYDDIAANNPAVKLFLKNGFHIEYQTAEIVMVKKIL